MRNLKRVLSLALALVMVLGMMVVTTSAATYTDADEITYTEAIDVMSGIGLYEGNPDGSLAPKQILTREMAATLITRIMLGDKMAKDLAPTKQIFTDVATDRWSAAAIEYCYNIGMIAGYNGEFNPEGQLTGTAFAKLLLCAMGYDAAAEGYEGADWEKNINADALTADLMIDGVNISKPLSREGAAQMILQALEANMVKYTTAYDYATGAPIVVGPNPVEVSALKDGYNGEFDGIQQFCEKYFPKLEKTDGYDDRWGRPADHAWEEGTSVYANIMKTPVKVYNVAVAECDIAKDLKLKGNGKIVDAWLNGVQYDTTGEYIELLATWQTIGEQGRLTEIYKNGTSYEIVMIDQFLAVVDDVTEVTYDKNGHIDEKATLVLTVFDCYEGCPETLVATTNYEYEVGDVLLVNYDVDGDADYVNDIEIIAYAESMIGTQSAYTTDPVHIVDDEEYPDAIQFNRDEADDYTSDYTWYFDTYGNLIGSFEIRGKSSYGVITSIYWKDSHNGEDGQAIATITYMDGSSETAIVYAIAEDGETLKDETAAILEGVEGKLDDGDYSYGYVSSTKSYNADEYANKALYKIETNKNGLVLTETDELIDAEITTGVPTLNADIDAGSSTQFLVYNPITKKYTTYTGIKNVPSYKSYTLGWYVDGRNDGVADYIFLVNAIEVDAEKTVTYFWDKSLNIKTHLKNNAVDYYTITGGYVNGTKAAIKVDADDAAFITDIENNKDTLLMLEIVNNYVADYTNDDEAVNVVTDTPVSFKIDGVTYYAVYAQDAVSADLVDDVLKADGSSYYVDGLDNVITYNKNLSQTIKYDDAAYLYVVYTQNTKGIKSAQVVYITDAEGTTSAGTLTAAKAAAIAEIKAAFKTAGLTDADLESTLATSYAGGLSVSAVLTTWTNGINAITGDNAIADVAAYKALALADVATVVTAYETAKAAAEAAEAAKVIKVETSADLVTAVSTAGNAGKTVKLMNNIKLDTTGALVVSVGLTLDGNGYALAASNTMGSDNDYKGAVIVLADDVTLKNLTVIGPNTTASGWDNGEYGIKLYGADAVLENVTVKQANAGIQVAKDATFKGTITVSGNEFGGIEVKDDAVLTIAEGATLVNTTETSALPTVWCDTAGDGSVVGGTLKEAFQGTGKMYWYVNAANA